MKHLIVNASPLILLGKIGRLELLHSLADKISVPNEVAKELTAGPESDPAREWLLARNVDEEKLLPAELDSRVMAWGLGPGETAVISAAIEKPESIAALDDRAARKCAAVFSLKVIGTPGLLLRAKTLGLIPAVAPEIEKLEAEGSFMDSNLKTAALSLACEDD